MENEIGEYGRTNFGRIIDKFAWLEQEPGKRHENKVILIKNNKVTNDFYYFEDGEYIVKHSKDIIDILECGDYVNGLRVFETENRINDNGEKIVLAENYSEWTDDGIIANKDIQIIVTKEMMESISYKVERK